MNQNILVAVDGSNVSEKAFEYVLKRSKELNDNLTILKVVESYGYPEKATDEVLKGEISQAENLIRKLEERAEKQGVKAESEVIVESNAANGIVKYAKEKGSDLIVVGGQGKTDLETVQLGSVSEGVVKRAGCPVLVYR